MANKAKNEETLELFTSLNIEKMKQILPLLLCCMTVTLPLNAQEFIDINGNIFPLSKVTNIRSSWQEHPASLSLLLQTDKNISLFCEALEATGWMDSLKCYSDKDYTVGADSTNWTNDALIFPTGTEYDNVAYMSQRLIAHTVFVEPDSVYKQKGILSLTDLKNYAKQVYDAVFPEDANISEITDTRNSLNRFVAYHILPFSAGYYQLTCVDDPNSTLAINWNRRVWDIADWYETCMPYSIMKCSFPSGTATGLYINRRGVQSRADERGVFVRGTKVADPTTMNGLGLGVNGKYHYIDDIIDYGSITQTVVLNERMRIDCSTLSPDFMTSGARGHYTRSNYENGKYSTWDGTGSHNNKRTCLGFKSGAARNFEFEDKQTHLHVRPRTLSFWSYQGDEVIISRGRDVKVKLPPVPAGTYELRLGTCVGFSNRGLIQFYIDDIPWGVPVDMRPGGVQLFGWKSDKELGEEEAIAAFDKSIHNQGWMKGPESYYSSSSESGGTQGTCFRDAPNLVRRVIGHFVSDGKTDHYLRMKQVVDDYYRSVMVFDYIELVPASIYDNETYVEDRW